MGTIWVSFGGGVYMWVCGARFALEPVHLQRLLVGIPQKHDERIVYTLPLDTVNMLCVYEL